MIRLIQSRTLIIIKSDVSNSKQQAALYSTYEGYPTDASERT